jgi:hypothetical protein
MPEKMKFRPANGSHGEWFMEKFCYQCKHDNPPDTMCQIIGNTMAHQIDDPEYPSEWIYDDNGHPTCTKFEPLEVKE